MSLILALLVSALTALPARAQSLDKPVERLAADSFAETIAAIEEIAASGAPHAQALLEALADRRLLIDPATKTVLFKDAAGAVKDARTAAPVATSPADPVTGKTRVDAVERYVFFRAGKQVTLTLSGPNGADNVDPWRIVTDSFGWQG